MTDDQRTEKHIDKVTLTNLFNADNVAQRAAAEERSAIASRIRGLKESHNLNTTAYGIAKRIAKLPSNEAAQLKRAVDLYCDMLDVGAQGDLEEEIARNTAKAGGRTETEAAMDGAPRGSGTVQSQSERADAGRVGSIVRPNTPAGEAAMATFTSALAEAVDVPSVNNALDRFTKDNPYLSEKAAEVAISRITKIEAAQSDGEADLRPDHLKNAGAIAAKQTAAANREAAKVKPGKARGPAKAKTPRQATAH